MPNAVLFNVYGTSEFWDATWYDPRESKNCEHKTVPIGKPIPNVEVYILDVYGTPVPIGIRGELYVGGIALARGYVSRPELEAEKFVRHPFSPISGTRLYKTGDMARYLVDGNIEFLGRKDEQVKLRGFRIELGEIDLALRGLPAINDATTVLLEPQQRLVAYVITKDGLAPADDELRQSLREMLPEYMVPSTFVAVDKFPLTPSGKIDRRLLALRRAMPAIAPRSAKKAKARNGTEQIIASVWQRALGEQVVGVDENFFDIGGHSLLIPRVQSLIRAKLRCELKVTDLFKYPTIRALANHIENVYQAKQLDALAIRQK
jgi:hypothetical protein